MGRTYYCARCMHSFTSDGEACPNLACTASRPDQGWGRLLQEGDLLDRHYRVHSRIAVGGAGITYRAREVDDDDEEVGPDLAIKVLLQSDGTFLRRLGNEARVLQELEHDHIVESLGFVHRTGKPAYLVTNYEFGGNLFDHVRHVGALPVDVASAVTEQILDALMMSHRRGIVHRDLKPQNILLRELVERAETPHVLVADFGIAKLAGFLGDGLTRVGTFVGTPEFAAPEQFKGLAPTPASDIYAAMCVFWFCLTGEPPITFSDRSDIVACLTTIRDAIPPALPDVIAVPPDVRARLDDLFAHTLVMEPEERWPAGTVLEALASLELGDLDLSDWTPSASTPVDTPTMGTMSPEALLEPEPEPAPDPEPTVEPQPEPETEPEPAPKPKRMRLRKTDETAPPPAPTASETPAADGLDALFESAKSGAVEVANRAMEAENAGSLEDLFAAPKPTPPPQPEPDPEPPPKTSPTSGSVLDASWETVAEPPRSPAPAPTPAPPPPEPEPAAPAAPWVPDAPEPVSSPLDDDASRLSALGSCEPSARDALLEGFSDPARAVGSVGSGASTATLCGANLTVAAHQLAGRAAWCRRLLTHDHPDVRATAALAVGAVGKAGQLTQLNRLLSDDAPKVRRATVFALKDLGERTGKQGLVENWLSAVANDPDPSVKAALQ